jgi:hypothetical protein
MTGTDLLAVHAETETQFAEQAGDGAGAHSNVQAQQLRRDLGGRPMGPSQTADGVARRIGLQQSLDGSDYFGRFFSTGLRPPPKFRTRSTATS